MYHFFLSTIVADHSASAILFPSTFASPLYFQTLPCDLIASISKCNSQSGMTGFLNLAYLHPLKRLIYFHILLDQYHERLKQRA